ncbi:MAG TPA: phytanoyl-CoA dioxygenase family protein, partial [Hellea balneolensis]|nr:phytanoyl-CoA dioxygenase family protein [Hellea balneolensis]
MLNAQDIQDYHTNGFLVLENFKSKTEIAALKKRATDIANAHDFSAHKDIFSTTQQRKNTTQLCQNYFLDSAFDISCFLEEKALDENGELKQSLETSINKIGHALHDLDPVFEAFSHGEKLAELATDLGLVQPQIWQSMYIFKQPRFGGQVDWHQDASFFQTKPITVTTFWFALDDARLDNGCLWVQKGGHTSPLRQIFVRNGDDTELRTIDPTPWPSLDEAISVPVKAGSLVCFHGL